MTGPKYGSSPTPGAPHAIVDPETEARATYVLFTVNFMERRSPFANDWMAPFCA